MTWCEQLTGCEENSRGSSNIAVQQLVKEWR
ncbi:hypothetical protein Pan181_04180 [Aeoliella mucimassa]|uniref:Uncharacterized protein n=1 Tax=Aeoliella mucimassa TaxID=2527972 RepID=A0A518AHM8_9BACT|nr:hypothetical protein Pan181_04180 [Aeoliella mucimassa]